MRSLTGCGYLGERRQRQQHLTYCQQQQQQQHSIHTHHHTVMDSQRSYLLTVLFELRLCCRLVTNETQQRLSRTHEICQNYLINKFHHVNIG